MDSKDILSDRELEKIVGGISLRLSERPNNLTVEQALDVAKTGIESAYGLGEISRELYGILYNIIIMAQGSKNYIDGARHFVEVIDSSGTTNETLLKITDQLRTY